MAFKHQAINFISGSAGSLFAFKEVAPQIDPSQIPDDENKIVVTLVTIVGGLISTLLTNLFSKLFKKKS